LDLVHDTQLNENFAGIGRAIFETVEIQRLRGYPFSRFAKLRLSKGKRDLNADYNRGVPP
ncbi:MAG: hypothetical protein ABSC26_13010, partial [Stellaceae bacterium]